MAELYTNVFFDTHSEEYFSESKVFDDYKECLEFLYDCESTKCEYYATYCEDIETEEVEKLDLTEDLEIYHAEIKEESMHNMAS